MKFAVFLFFSSCVDESQLCRGEGLCADNDDYLKWCKNEQRIMTSVDNGSLPFQNLWKPLFQHFECSLPYSSKVVSSHQQVETANKQDRLAYHCFNRADETPFHGAISNNGGEKKEKTWVDLVNEPCDLHKYSRSRKCLGKGVTEECIHSSGK